jgi:hypothetical protein
MIYTIEELEGEAKETALTSISTLYQMEPPWRDEHFKSMTKVISKLEDCWDYDSESWKIDPQSLINDCRDCNITGYCADVNACAVLNVVDMENEDIYDVSTDIESIYEEAWDEEMEYALQDEQLIEFAMSNNMMFTQSGAYFQE